MPTPLSVLALEPWFGGSHARFLESWARRSRHRVRVLGLPDRHWKWRMQSSTWTFSAQLVGAPPDVIQVSDYVDLSRLCGFLPPAWRDVPTFVYFHENQLSYPLRPGEPQSARDLGFGFMNVLSCLAADAVVFNSHYHLQEFRAAADDFLRTLPKPRPRRALAERLELAHVIAPGIELDEHPLGPGPPAGAPLRLAFNHRWEHDKDPGAFARAVAGARAAGARLELVLLGESYEQVPEEAAALLREGALGVLHRGFAATREEYARLLGECDLIVSTARHEFFGMAALEGMASGLSPLLPERLAYPEVLPREWHAGSLFEDEAQLVARLCERSRATAFTRERAQRVRCRALAATFDSGQTASRLDALCDELGASRERSSRAAVGPPPVGIPTRPGP